MQWLLVGNITSAVADALVRHGHTAHLAAGNPDWPATPLDLLRKAQEKQFDLLTTDPGLANAPFEHNFFFNRSIVFLQLEGGDVEQDDAIDRLFARYKRLSPRRLYTLTASRVKIRQLPGA